MQIFRRQISSLLRIMNSHSQIGLNPCQLINYFEVSSYQRDGNSIIYLDADVLIPRLLIICELIKSPLNKFRGRHWPYPISYRKESVCVGQIPLGWTVCRNRARTYNLEPSEVAHMTLRSVRKPKHVHMTFTRRFYEQKRTWRRRPGSRTSRGDNV